jgi:kinesin family member 11
LEETLSTLDYALRAKSIKNKPELNQRMTRNSLLKEYAAEIEHLKADLLAAREKNGIFFSEETWNRLNSEQELRETELMEAKKQVAIVENQMRNVRDEFDESIALLKRREEELQDTQARLEETEKSLDLREKELREAINSYDEEVVVRQAHQATEVSLDEIASGLKRVVAQSLRDINGLFDKLGKPEYFTSLTSVANLVCRL